VRPLKKGRCKVLEDGIVKRYVIGDSQVVFEPRKGREGQFKVGLSEGPGEEMEVDTFATKLPKLQIIEEEGGDTVSLKNVPIAKAGVWNGIQITKKILDGLKTRFEKLREKLFVPLKLEHSGIKESEEQSSQGPALGWLTRICLFGDALYGDFVKVPKSIARLIKNGQYIGVSPEIARNFEGVPDVLVGVALLGAALPAMTTLPKLLTLYAEKEGVDTYKPSIPISEFGGEMSETETKVEEETPQEEPKTDGDILYATRILFQRKSSPDEFAEVKGALKLKKYPAALAEEMIELLPDPTIEKADVIPEYTLEMVAQRVDILTDRAKQAEKAEKVIEEVEETLEIFKEELETDEQKELKAKLEEALKTAKENKGTTELEEAIEKEVPKEEPVVEEKYPKAPEYPQVSENVTVDLQKMESELKARALGLVKATVEKFESKGWNDVQCRMLNDLLILLDPALTSKPEPENVRTLVFQLIGAAPQTIKTFEAVSTPQVEDNSQYIDILTKATKRARANR